MRCAVGSSSRSPQFAISISKSDKATRKRPVAPRASGQTGRSKRKSTSQYASESIVLTGRRHAMILNSVAMATGRT